MANTQSPASTLRAAWIAQAQASPWVTAGLGGSLLAVLVLLLASGYNALDNGDQGNLRYALAGGSAGFAATAFGALLAIGLRTVSQRTQDSLLGFAAGMMLAAASFSLILPGLAAGEEILGNSSLAAVTVVLGLGLGALLMLGLDRFTPHEHASTGPCGPDCERLNRVWLFVFAIALHNLPEGMAIGVSFANGDMSVGLPLTTAISIQDIPEGLAVALALRAVGLSALVSALVAAASGLMEPLGALVGMGISTGFAIAYPVSLGLAAGAMIFVVSHEVIPETHRNGHQTPATIGLMIGFGVMMFLDTALG
ncbi:ZIP family metal transporter [Stutzerimonas balearica]|jgi:ZIP family zinc transporter|uniref:Membrane protein n=1 Tax=Stutzerimonas balearica DSM 6083 TaxID=1123016 RepID=A0A8D4C337_9GAMM|nr:ZIP family metal transporter [Stutzerimonas balearica]KIL05711.1 membrane protein [Stutzerimonas stutzeri]MBZ5756668.1 ZIP family metal transporter [Pseudomonas sp. S5(2021)]WIX01387.1 ZIP family metal transporter [Pseudomonas sp. AR5]HCW95349.1 ZIP family metal transporter [Pseudomonas sp.]AJE15745.1 membrane protein [Stutzerimonas balearica DSM 6083]